MGEIQLKRMEMEKATQHFKQLHAERQEFLKQWESTLQLIEKHDGDLNESQSRKHSLEQKITEARIAVRDQKLELDDIERQIEDVQKSILSLERVIGLARTDFHARKTELDSFVSELQTLKAASLKGFFQFLILSSLILAS